MEFATLKNTATVAKVKEALGRLKMPTMADTFNELATNPTFQEFTLVECVNIMATKELEHRALRRQERYLQRSGLKELSVWNQADISHAICEAKRNFKERDLRRLLTCDWLRETSNLMIDGATGTGKTWILATVAKEACRQGFQTGYYRYPKLLELLADAREHRETATVRQNLNKNKLLVIDDFGTSSITDDLASDLLTIIEEREGNSSLAIASQVPFKEWHQCFGSGCNADAIMDRLLNTSYKIELAGQSMRERDDIVPKQTGNF